MSARPRSRSPETLNSGCHRSRAPVLDRAERVCVKTHTGKTFLFGLEVCDGIGTLNRKLADEGVWVHDTHLALQLDNYDMPLMDINMKKESTLHLVPDVKPQGRMQIFVQTPTGKTISVDAATSDTIPMLKAKIFAKAGIPPDEQRLSLELKDYDGSTLGNVVQKGSTLKLTNPGDGMIPLTPPDAFKTKGSTQDDMIPLTPPDAFKAKGSS